MRRLWWAACCAVLPTLAGCQSSGSGTVGGPIAAYAATALAGPAATLLSGEIAGGLSAEDLGTASAAEYRALESGRAGVTLKWQGRAAEGEILVGPLYRINDTDCRDYTHVITGPDGEVETGRGLACRAESGGWRPVA